MLHFLNMNFSALDLFSAEKLDLGKKKKKNQLPMCSI